MSITEYGVCGSLDWTVKAYGRVTHKHSCPNRTDPWCQQHPKSCEPPTLTLDEAGVERLAAALDAVSENEYDLMAPEEREDRYESARAIIEALR